MNAPGNPERPSLLGELQRRRVFRVAGVYVVAGFAFIQAAELIFPRVGMPDWTVSAAVVITLLGFPVACALAWAFDIGPAGVVRSEGWRTSAGAHPRRAALAYAGAGAIVAIVLLGTYATFAGDPLPEDGGLDSIAVLPFVDMSAAQDQEYFADGITEEILNALAQVEGLHVAARTSSFAYKGRNLPIDSIARQLGVRTVLEGSLRRDGDRLRVTAQLIDASNGYHLWSENYDRDARDVFAIQDEISRAITDALRIELGMTADEPLVDAATESATAHDFYLRGLYELNRRGQSDLRDALELFRQAVTIDPDYADAWVGLGMTYDLLPLYVSGTDTEEAVRLAREALQRALALEPMNGRAHAVLGDLLYHYDWDIAGSEREHRTAIRLSPSDALAYTWLAEPLYAQGRTAEAVEASERAIRLSPLDPKLNADYVWYLYLDRRYADAERAALRNLEMNPGHRVTEVNLAINYLAMGRIADAHRLFAVAADGPSFGWVRAELGERALAGVLDPARRSDGLAAAREAAAAGEYLSAATYFVALGEPDEAIRTLTAAVDRRADSLPGNLTEPVLDPIREDPRFQDLVRRTRQPIRR